MKPKEIKDGTYSYRASWCPPLQFVPGSCLMPVLGWQELLATQYTTPLLMKQVIPSQTLGMGSASSYGVSCLLREEGSRNLSCIILHPLPLPAHHK